MINESGLPELPDSDNLNNGGLFYGSALFTNITSVGSFRLPPHASAERDVKLRQVYNTNEFMQGIISTLQLLLYNTLDISVQAKSSLVTHTEIAEIYNKILFDALDSEVERFISDLLITDNGGFLFIEGEGAFHEPLKSMPTGLRCLDSLQCVRTRNNIYPVVYTDPESTTRYPIHESRIIYMSQSPSNEWQKNKVGYSSVSKVNMLGKQLIDLTTYSLEQLGSIEAQRIVHASGVSRREIEDAIENAELTGRNEGRTHSTRTVYIASRDPNGKLNLLDWKNGTMGSERREDVETLIALMSMSLNVQTFVFLESTQSSSTRGAAKESIKLSNGYKLPAWFFKKFTTQLSKKFLPDILQITLNGEANDIDGTKSRIALNNALTAKNNVTSGITNARIERENMVRNGILTAQQFEELELGDERLPNGLHISTVFYDQQLLQHSLLQFNSVENVLVAESSEELLLEINQKISDCVTRINTSTSEKISRKLTHILYALQWLENYLQAPNDIDVVDVDKPLPQDTEIGGPRERNIVNDNPERDYDNENSTIERSDNNIENDWLYNILTGNDDNVLENFEYTKEATRRFRSAIRSLTRGLWSEEIDKETFVSELTAQLSVLLSNEYNKEVKSIYGVNGDTKQLNEILNRNEQYVDGFAEYVLNNIKGVGKLQDVYARADNWIALYDEVMTLAKLDPQGDDRELIWRVGNTEHCSTCLEYRNVIKTRSEWKELADRGIRPQSRALACKGYKCQCTLEEL